MPAQATARPGRPPGPVRAAVLAALEQGPGTLRDIAERSQVGYSAARYTVQDALRSGAVQICGQEKRAHSKRWLAVYELAEPPEVSRPTCQCHCELSCALAAWSR